MNPRTSLIPTQLFLWSANPVNSNIQNWQFIANAQEAGAKLVAVDALFSPSAAKADRWISMYPGTDGAYILGLCRKFINEKLYNADFVMKHTCAPFLVKKSNGMYLRGSESGIAKHPGPHFLGDRAPNGDRPDHGLGQRCR